jgi:hypothetical protein
MGTINRASAGDVLAAGLAAGLMTACGGIAVIDSDGDLPGPSSTGGGFQTSCYSADEGLTIAQALEHAKTARLPSDAKLVSVRNANGDRCGNSLAWELLFDGLTFVLVGPGGVESTMDGVNPCDDAITPIDSALLIPDAAARMAAIDPTPATADGYTNYIHEQASLCGAHTYQVIDHPLVTVLRQWPEAPHNWPNYKFSVHYDSDGTFSKICGPCDHSSECLCP